MLKEILLTLLLSGPLLLAAKHSLLYPASTFPLQGQSMEAATVLVSGYSSEVGVYQLVNSVLSRTGSWQVDPSLSWIQQVNGSFYAIHEVDTFKGQTGGVVSRWEIVNGQLERQEHVNLGKTFPAHLLIDTDHNLALTANYGSSSVNVIQMSADGMLKEVVQTLAYGEGCRDASHPHQVIRAGDVVWIVDLGCDAVYNYRIEGNELQYAGKVQVEEGAGPRHMVVDEDKKLAYLVCELKNFLLVFSYDESGNLQQLEKVEFAEKERQYGAEILLSQDRNTLYASSRGNGIISVYRVQNNSLVKIQEVQLVGTWPRSFALRGNVMLAADQKSSQLQILSVDGLSGMLTPGGSVDTPEAPAFVMFLD